MPVASHDHVRALLDTDRSPLEQREAALQLSALCDAAAGRPTDPFVDAWRMMAWARGLDHALGDQEAPRVLAIGATGPVLVAGLAGRADATVALLDTEPARLRAAAAALAAFTTTTVEIVPAIPETWTPPAPFHVGVDLRMAPALHETDAVGTAAALRPHCAQWVPDSVVITAVLVDDTTQGRRELEPVAVLDAEGLTTQALTLPPLDEWGDRILLGTTITCHGSHRLTLQQSGLTMDRPLPPGTVLPGGQLALRWDPSSRRLALHAHGPSESP